jgi:lipase
VATPPHLTSVNANGITLAVWDWPGEDPAILFAHATGFHGRCWDRIAREFPRRRRVAPEFRGHGRSAKPAPPYHWDIFGCELAAIADALSLDGAIGVGHSMGGHAVVNAAHLRPATFSSLLLIDPTIFPDDYYGGPKHEVDFIRRRRNSWTSPDAMFERFRHRAPFASWNPEILRDYCEYGLLPSGEGFELACPPEVEASIYEQSHAPEANLHRVIPAIQIPVAVMRAGTGWKREAFSPSSSPTAPDLASEFPRARDMVLPDHDHYIPMTAPELVVAEIRGAAEG